MPAVVQTANTRTNSNATVSSVAPVFGASPTVGNIMLALIGKASNSAVTAPAGWTADTSSTSAAASAYLYHRVVQSGDGTTYTWSWTGAIAAGSALVEVSGQDVTTPIDVNNALGQTVSNTVSITTNNNGELIVALIIAQDSSGSIGTSPTITKGAAYTLDFINNGSTGNTTKGMGNGGVHQTQGSAGAINDGYSVVYNNAEVFEARGIFGINPPLAAMQHSQGVW